MARLNKKQAKQQQQQQKTSFAPRKAESKPILAVFIFSLGLLYTVALFDFDPLQSELKIAGGPKSENIAGALGAMAADYSIFCFGIATWIIPAFLLWLSLLLASKKARRFRPRLFLAFITCLGAATGIAQLVENHFLLTPSTEAPTGQIEITEIAPDTPLQAFVDNSVYYNGISGELGELVLHPYLVDLIGIGAALLVIVLFLTSLVFLLTDNPAKSIEEFKEGLAESKARRAEKRKQAVQSSSSKHPKGSELDDLEPFIPRAPGATDAAAVDDPNQPPPPPLRSKKSTHPSIGPPASAAKSQPRSGVTKRPAKSDAESKKGSLFSLSKRKQKEDTLPPPPDPAAPQPAAAKSKTPSNLTIFASEKTEKVVFDIPKRKGDYEFPPLELLAQPDEDTGDTEPEDHQETADTLIQTLDEFGVKVSPSEVHTGPVITRYEIVPAAGVRVEKILNLDKNIALGLKAAAVRILAPVPGKGTVGIEVPNRNPVPVCMREIIESKAWAKSKAEIPVVLGKDVTGKPIVEDLTKMPHMLIAGSTGSGKTVCINSIIASLLYHSSPDDLRFIMVDPKVVEMQVYNALPHMLIPVVTDPKKVPGALKYLINEMERRYQIFAKVGVRNIAGFNAKIVKDKIERAKAAEQELELDAEMSAEERVAAAGLEVPRDEELEIPDKKMHYIVCIIDELADLMMVAPQDIETGVARIAQLARAAGIHLILATQRPSVNVITGVIKANLPTRISFKVASKIDSRTILDGGGAEALIGKGDMLFIPPGTSNMVRAQGAFVSDDEINSIVDFLEKNGPPEFVEDIQKQIDGEGEGGGFANNTYEDELVPDAIGVLKASKRASTSMLQRRLKIGYNRAARIMEILEDEGIVGPENGSSPREILKDLDLL